MLFVKDKDELERLIGSAFKKETERKDSEVENDYDIVRTYYEDQVLFYCAILGFNRIILLEGWV